MLRIGPTLRAAIRLFTAAARIPRFAPSKLNWKEPMRAEPLALREEIEQSMGLLRRHL